MTPIINLPAMQRTRIPVQPVRRVTQRGAHHSGGRKIIGETVNRAPLLGVHPRANRANAIDAYRDRTKVTTDNPATVSFYA